MGIGLYGSGMVDFIYDEMELGWRVAKYLDEEWNCDPLWWVMDYYYRRYCLENGHG